MMINDKLRIDKNIAHNILDLKYDDGQTQIIIKSLIIYFSFSYQTDLFGYGTLDPTDFAKKMKLDRASLFRVHPNPKQIIDSPYSAEELYAIEKADGKFSQSRVWDSYLENALYLLSTTPLLDNYKGATDDRQYIGISSFILIRDRRITTKKANKGRTNKIFYQYKLDEVFERNLRRFFLQTKFANYIESKKNNIDDFYLSLNNIYQTYRLKGITHYRWKLPDLLRYFTISNSIEIKFQKSRLNAKLKIIERIMKDEIPGLKFYWEKGDGQRWKYVPCCSWDAIDMQTVKNSNYKVIDGVFLKHLRRNLLDVYYTQTDGNEKDVERGFYNWLMDKKNSEVQQAAYVSTYSLYHKVSRFPSPKTLAKGFISKIYEAKGDPKKISEAFEPS